MASTKRVLHLNRLAGFACCLLVLGACNVKEKTYSMDISAGYNTPPLSGNPPCNETKVVGRQARIYNDSGKLVATSRPFEQTTELPGTIFTGECGWHTTARVPKSSWYVLKIDGRSENTRVSWEEFQGAAFQTVAIQLTPP